ncbi:MAG: hypothetical protein AAB611_01215, partial [Patescibacteria group bacterium]
PEDGIRRENLDIPMKTPQEWEEELKKKNINISDRAREMLYHKDFITLKEPETIDLVRLTVADLGFLRATTTQQIFDRAQELGLELCPPEVGLAQRLKDTNQPIYGWYSPAMKQISASDGDPSVFELEHYVGGLWLNIDWAGPDNEWNPVNTFVFRLSKSSF